MVAKSLSLASFSETKLCARLTDSDVPVVTVEALNLDAIQLQREAVQLG